MTQNVDIIVHSDGHSNLFQISPCGIINESIAHGVVPDEIMLIRYRTDKDLWRFLPDMQPLPASTHASMLARLRRALRARGIQTTIEFMKPDEYWEWLGGRADTEATRAGWGIQLPQPAPPITQKYSGTV